MTGAAIMIDFFVVGIPKATPRMKAFSRGNRAGVYDPGSANDWKALVVMQAKKYCPPHPFEGGIRCDLTFYLPRPKNFDAKKYTEGLIPHTSKPDLDNLWKAVLDALTNAGMWRDDSQVYRGEVIKWYHGKGGVAGCRICIREDR